jgi:hypothetical protein
MGARHILTLLVPFSWSVVYLATVVFVVRLSIRKKYVRLKTPIVCTAGGKHEALMYYKMGSAVASPLQALAALLWGNAVTRQIDRVLREVCAGSATCPVEAKDLKLVQIGAICGVVSSVFAYLAAHYSILTHETIHEVVFALCMIFGWIWCIAMTYYTESTSDVLFDLRRILLAVNWVCILGAFGYMKYGKYLKHKFKKSDFRDAIDFLNAPTLPRYSNSPSDTTRSKEPSDTPWDPFVQVAAILSYIALAAFVGLVLSTTMELHQEL